MSHFGRLIRILRTDHDRSQEVTMCYTWFFPLRFMPWCIGSDLEWLSIISYRSYVFISTSGDGLRYHSLLTLFNWDYDMNRDVSLHVKRERVRVERDRRVWRHQNMCALWHCSGEATRHTSRFSRVADKFTLRCYMNISVRDENQNWRIHDP